MIRDQYPRLGDLYSDPVSTTVLRSITGNKPWRQLVFGIGAQSHLTDEQQKTWRSRIQGAYSRLRASGRIDPVDAGDASTAAANGVFIIPSLGQFGFDPDSKAAYNLMLDGSGLRDLWNELAGQISRGDKIAAIEMEKTLKTYDGVIEVMGYVSGAKALELVNDKWNQVVAKVNEARQLQDEARASLDDEGYRKVRDELMPINGAVEKLQGYFSTAEAGRLGGAVVLAEIIAVGVVLIVLSVVLAIVVKTLAHARNVAADEAARIRRREEENIQGDYAMQKDNLLLQLDEGLITQEEYDRQMEEAQERRDADLAASSRDFDQRQKALPSSGVGGLSLGLGAVAAVGLIAVLMLKGK